VLNIPVFITKERETPHTQINGISKAPKNQVKKEILFYEI